MPWIRLPKSGIPMHINGPLRAGQIEIPAPAKAESKPAEKPKPQATEKAK